MKNFKEIENYFSGNLSEQKKTEFENLLKSDEALRSEYDTYIASQNLIEYLVGKELIENLPELVSDNTDTQHASSEHFDYIPKNSEPVSESAKIVSIERNQPSVETGREKTTFQVFKNLRVAASLLILVSIFAVSYYYVSYDGFSSITEQNVSYLDLSQMRGKSNIQKYQELIDLQAEGNYTASNKLIDELMTAEPVTYDYLVYFKGQNNFRLKNYAIAEKEFEEVITLNLPKYVEHAQLMKVFTAIETKNITLAKSRINQLEKQPLYSYKEVLVKVKDQLNKK